jgi:chromosome segregation ATPase
VNQTLSLTDEIYAELVDGLKTGLDWTQFVAKHGASKGPLYNAIGRFLNDMEAKVRALSELQAKLDAAGLKLDSLDQKIKEADKAIRAKTQHLVAVEEKGNTLKKRIEGLERDLQQKGDLLKRLRELEKLGFGKGKLAVLHTTLAEIGSKRGLKWGEAVNTFFAELKDYDAIQGFSQELQRLETIIRTKTLEAERWQAETDSLARRHKDLSEAITAVQSLIKNGVKTEEIVSWNKIVSVVGGPAELQGKLGEYKSTAELLAARKKEIEDYGKKITELTAQIKALNQQKVEIEGAIRSLSTSGVKKITKVSDKAITVLKSLSNSGVKEIANVSDKAMTGLKALSSSGGKEITEVSGKSLTELKSLSTSGVQEITKVGDKALTELKSLLTEMRDETKRLGGLKTEAGKLEKELMYARYFTTGDEAVLKSFPKEVVIAFLDRASVYCKLNQLNPRVRALDFGRKYVGIESYAEVDLIDLIRWAQAGLAGAPQ